jgi:multidrug efflux pump subunit AcrB
MAHGKTGQEKISRKRNMARFFVKKRHVSWVLLIATCLWGVYGYLRMPHRKDPEFQVRTAVSLVPWPGASAEKVEQLVTKKVEEQIAANVKVTKIESISRTGLAVIYFELDENVKETGKEFDDIKLKLDAITDLPSGAGPINFIKDLRDTPALMLTVASPKTDEEEIALRAKAIQSAIETERASTSNPRDPSRFTLVFTITNAVDRDLMRTPTDMFLAFAKESGFGGDLHVINGDSFIAFDGVSNKTEPEILAYVEQFVTERMQSSEFHPDAWPPFLVRNPLETLAKLNAVAGDKYTYRQMDDFTDLIEKTLKTVPQVSKVARSGNLDETVYLIYSQERLASYGVQPSNLENVLKGRNITTPGGQVNVQGKNVNVDPSGEFKSEREIGDVLVPAVNGSTVYLRDLAHIVRGYETPAPYLNYFNSRDAQGNWRRSRAITLSVHMRSGEQIDEFGKQIDVAIAGLKQQLPEDLIYARTSDQPLQVEEVIDLFMKSLYDARARHRSSASFDRDVDHRARLARGRSRRGR